MRIILVLAITLPLWGQAPDAQPAAGAQPAKQEAQQPAQPAPAQPAAQAAQPAAATPPAAGSEALSGSVDVGYRFITGVGGDMNTYRSVVNLGEGPKLFGADLMFLPTNSRYADRIQLNLSSWGGDPYNTARFAAHKAGLYDLRFDYRNIAYYNFLPSYANPGTVNPALPFLNQNGFDTFRRTMNGALDLFPGRRIIPYFAYGFNSGRGSGTTDFVLQNDEFVVPTSYSDRTNEYRGGVRFEFNRWHATLEGGGYFFRDSQQVHQGSQLPNPGNNLLPVLGQQLFFAGGNEAYGIRGDAVFTRALLSADPTSWLNLSASFLYSQPKNDVHYTQANTGQFINLAIPMFYNGEIATFTGVVKQPHPAGTAGFVLRPFSRLTIIEAFSTDRMHSDPSGALLDQLLTTGQPPTTSQIAAASQFATNYNQQEINGLFDITSKMTLRGGWRYRWGDLLTAPPSITSSGQGFVNERAKLKQNIGLGGFTFRTPQQFRFNVDFEASPGGPTLYRTSVNQYVRARILGQWRPVSSLEVSATFNVMSNQNPDPAVKYDYLWRDNAFTLSWNPTSRWKGLAILAEYDRTTFHSSILYIIPSELAPALSLYRESDNIGTLLADVPFNSGTNPWKISFGGSVFRSSGTRPARYYQPMARFTIPLGRRIQFNTEWRWYAMTQPFYLYEGFRSNQFVTALRFML